ncbi:MAG TPA: 1-(5-phosphoribosyl)-5-[(5-phosphoribosylamino)methylideneamino]imidazole-4-carboxamide isomerase [Stellaceae bacterium]|nr:1-(5-phosphoribosyl)-5-[(5-phosphoribosylamino)methylideneamino]imidazole-4-carboxamide isomerase [Stellaceae bacterium]
MIIYPAIDLKGGACVRLLRGDMASATVFSNDPPGQAQRFAELGFEWLHVVDLDGAFAGRSVNGMVVQAIRDAVPSRIQLGGGIRDRAAIEFWLRLGIDRVILSTAALREPELVRRAATDYPGRIVVGIDSRDGRAAVDGWGQTGTTLAVDLARRFVGAGVAAIAYTDISRDGAMSGINLPSVVSFARQVGMPVIAAGGIGGAGDIAALAAHEQDGIVGAICGRALYEGRLDPREALRLASEGGAGC